MERNIPATTTLMDTETRNPMLKSTSAVAIRVTMILSENINSAVNESVVPTNEL
jgi:hypothetical protein